MVGKGLNVSLNKADETLKILDALKRGDRVVILWHDACRVTNDPDVRAEYYSTPKETQGTVYDCLPDPEYPSVFYLIVCGETTMGKPDYYDAIPIAWIAKIQKLEVSEKHPRKEMKLTTQIIKRVLLYEGGVLVNDTGGMSKIPLKRATKGYPAQKYVEEISKVVR
jgi:hypothetical protein